MPFRYILTFAHSNFNKEEKAQVKKNVLFCIFIKIKIYFSHSITWQV